MKKLDPSGLAPDIAQWIAERYEILGIPAPTETPDGRIFDFSEPDGDTRTCAEIHDERTAIERRAFAELMAAADAASAAKIERIRRELRASGMSASLRGPYARVPQYRLRQMIRRRQGVQQLPARPAPRRRGAGRPSVRGASRRSSARSGDSGDADPDESEPHTCECGCGAPLVKKAGPGRPAKYLDENHKKKHHRRGDRGVDLDLRNDRPIRLVTRKAICDLTAAEALALLHHVGKAASYCARHRCIGECPDCSQLLDGQFLAHCSSVIHSTRHRHKWRGERGEQPYRAEVRRLWTDDAPIWGELPPLTHEQAVVIYGTRRAADFMEIAA